MDPSATRSRQEAIVPPIFTTIGIVGLGLIGGSIALAARRQWPGAVVIGVDRGDALDRAVERGVAHLASADLAALADADLVVLAAPVRQNVGLLAELGAHVRGSAVVTDTGSTKRDIVGAAACLPGRLTFVGGHPMGGAAAGGIEHAHADLFRGRPWILTPAGDVASDASRRLEAFAAALGAVPRVMTAAEHDRVLAFVSHLPQLTASALMHVIGGAVGADALALAGRGLVDTTRLASSPPGIWRDIAASNADELAPALDALIRALESLRADLPSGRRLDEVFRDAAAWREALTSRSV